MPKLTPPDCDRAARRICMRHGLDHRTLDWHGVMLASDRLEEDEQWALSLFCAARGEYAREQGVDGPELMKDENGRPIWRPGTGDFETCRILFGQLGLIKEEGGAADEEDGEAAGDDGRAR